MNIRVITFSLLSLLLLVACERKEEAQWFTLAAGETIIVQADMPAHTEKQFDIPSVEPMLFSLQSNASYELMEKHNFDKRLPVRLEHRKSIVAIATVKGAGIVWFVPVDGVIPITLRNETDERLSVIVVRRPGKYGTE